jgi:hypothetical protein
VELVSGGEIFCFVSQKKMSHEERCSWFLTLSWATVWKPYGATVVWKNIFEINSIFSFLKIGH